jgi:putative DNA primase/helicase
MTTLADAAAQMRACGMPELPLGHPVTGKIVRYGPKKTAWYILHEHRLRNGSYVVVGAFGQWGAIEKLNIEVDWKSMSAEDAAALQQQQRHAENREREKIEERQKRAANRARGQWKSASADASAHPYIARKQITAEGARAFNDGTLLVPAWLWDADTDSARLVSLQKIDAYGGKRFNKNGITQGAACRLGGLPTEGQTILVAEGFATGASIRLACEFSHPVFVAFNAGNLPLVVGMLRARYASSALVICADDDWKTTKPDGTPWNPGLDYASRAALAHGAFVVAPVFPSAADREAAFVAKDKWTDFNDLHVKCGIELVRVQIREAIAQAESSRAEGISTLPAVGTGGVVVAGPWAVADDGPPPALPLEAYGKDEVAAARQKKKRPAKPKPGPGADDPKWMWRVQYGREGPKVSVHNAHLFLTHHAAFEGVLGYDLFAEQVVKLKPPPWGGELGEWKDMDDNRLLLWLSPLIGEPPDGAIAKAVVLAARQNEFNPVTDRLGALVWDQVPRLQTWLIDWCSVMKGPRAQVMDEKQLGRLREYAEIIGPRWLISAVARAFEPGCQVDTMLILEGEGGFLKSSMLRAFGGKWFSDAKLNLKDKDSLMVLQGKLVHEMAELEGMNRAESSEIKMFITHREDVFRLPYGRRVSNFLRRVVFCGSINYGVYLKDDTGNRRFWSIEVGGVIDIVNFKLIVDQLWAEAVHWYRAFKAGDRGCRWWIEGEREKGLMEEQQEERFVQDAWETLVRQFLDCLGKFKDDPMCSRFDSVTQDQIMSGCLRIDVGKRDDNVSRRLGKILSRIGWVRKRKTSGDRGYYYVRPDEDDSSASPPQLEGQQGSNTNGGEDDDIPL